MIFIKHSSLKSVIIFNPIFIPYFSGFMFFRVQIFQRPGFSGSRFFRVQIFQGPGPGFRSSRYEDFFSFKVAKTVIYDTFEELAFLGVVLSCNCQLLLCMFQIQLMICCNQYWHLQQLFKLNKLFHNFVPEITRIT